jgi:DNA-binding transcriptional MerR regulator
MTPTFPQSATPVAPSRKSVGYVLIFMNIMAKLNQIAFEFIPEEQNSAVEDPGFELTPPQENQAGEVSATPREGSEKMEQQRRPLSRRGRLSLKEADINADLIQIPPDEILFQKQYYSIGQVAKWFRVNQSLLRYWETEFDILEPRKNRKGDRFFRPVDVKNLLLIHDLLRRRKFTLEGAKDYLKKNRNAEEKFAMIQSLEKIKSFFLELKASL